MQERITEGSRSGRSAIDSAVGGGGRHKRMRLAPTAITEVPVNVLSILKARAGPGRPEKPQGER